MTKLLKVTSFVRMTNYEVHRRQASSRSEHQSIVSAGSLIVRRNVDSAECALSHPSARPTLRKKKRCGRHAGIVVSCKYSKPPKNIGFFVPLTAEMGLCHHLVSPSKRERIQGICRHALKRFCLTEHQCCAWSRGRSRRNSHLDRFCAIGSVSNSTFCHHRVFTGW